MGGISIWQLLIILVIIILLFGTKKLRSMGSDLGSGLREFKKAVKEEEPDDKERLPDEAGGDTYENETSARDKDKT